MGLLKKLWKKLKPVRKVGEAVVEDYVRRKIEKETGVRLEEEKPEE